MSRATILVSDVENESRELLVNVLQDHLGYQAEALSGPAALLEHLTLQQSSLPQVILMDVSSDHLRVVHAMDQLQRQFPYIPIIALTHYGDMKQAASALDAGAMDFLARPVAHQRLKVSVDNAIRQHHMAVELASLRHMAVELASLRQKHFQHGSPTPVSTLPKSYINHLLEGQNLSADRLLMMGEEGTAKEAMAEVIHHHSARNEQVFCSVNCSTLTVKQFENFIFSGEEGEYSRFISNSLGGSLLIHQPELLPKNTQLRLVQLLKKLEREPPKRFSRASAGLAVMISTNLSMSQLRQSGRLIIDFYDYLDGPTLPLLSLRELPSLLPEISAHYAQSYTMGRNVPIERLSPSAIQLVENYHWPGNIRELERVIMQATLLCDDAVMESEHLLPCLPMNPLLEKENEESFSYEKMMRLRRVALISDTGQVRRLRDLEADMIRFAFSFYEGRISEVARKLGIGRSTLYRKLHELDIEAA